MAIQWEAIAWADSGHESHPGDQYHNVEVEISRTANGEWWKISAEEAWGSNQGYLEEHGSVGPIVARARDYESARAEVIAQSVAADMTESDLMRALGRAESQDEFEEALMGEPEPAIQIHTVGGNVASVAGASAQPGQAQDGPDLVSNPQRYDRNSPNKGGIAVKASFQILKGTIETRQDRMEP